MTLQISSWTRQSTLSRTIDWHGQLLADDLHPIGRLDAKADLFAADAQNRDADVVVDHVFDADRATLAERLARRTVYKRQENGGERPIPLLLMLHSATEPRAAELLRSSLDRNVLRPLAECLGGPDAEVRATMVIAQCAGFAMLNQLLRPRALAEAQQEALVDLLKESLAACISRVPAMAAETAPVEPRPGRSRYAAGD